MLGADEAKSGSAQREATAAPPAVLRSLKLLSGVHVTTVQTVVVMETGGADAKAAGLQLSVEKMTGGVLFKQGSRGAGHVSAALVSLVPRDPPFSLLCEVPLGKST